MCVCTYTQFLLFSLASPQTHCCQPETFLKCENDTNFSTTRFFTVKVMQIGSRLCLSCFTVAQETTVLFPPCAICMYLHGFKSLIVTDCKILHPARDFNRTVRQIRCQSLHKFLIFIMVNKIKCRGLNEQRSNVSI